MASERIWKDICELESNDIRAHMIETVLISPEHTVRWRQMGVYGMVLSWLSRYRRGIVEPFPFTRRAPPPAQTTQLIISPAAKALDYFQESLTLLDIAETEELTLERLKAGYKKASLRAHPDKGGSKEAFDEIRRAFQYVEKIIARVNPSTLDQARITAPVTMTTATAYRSTAPTVAAAPITLSAKKMDMSLFNKMFEENRLPDPSRDSGYADWLKAHKGTDEVASDERLKGKFNKDTFDQIFKEKVHHQTSGMEIIKRLEPDAIVSTIGTELGGETTNFSAMLGAETQFTDLKEAYTSGATIFQDVKDVRLNNSKVGSVEDISRRRNEDMNRVIPDEATNIALAAAAVEEREKQRRLRLAASDVAATDWSEQMRRRLFVMDK